MKSEQNFTSGKIYLPFLKFCLPILAALVLQACYGMADLMIVGRFGVASDVSAVSSGSMILQTVQSIITGLSMGTTVMMGRKIGQNRHDECGRVIEGSIWLFGIMGITLAAFMIIFAKKISLLMHVPDEALTQCVYYVSICGAGLLFITAYNILSGIMRGMGNSKIPMITVAIACVINIGGDLLLVGVFHLAAAGAAIATVAAQGISVFISILLLKKMGLPFRVKMRGIKNYGEEIKEVVKIGLPIALQDLLVSISFTVVMTIVNTLGVIVSAGVGVAEKLCQIIMLSPSAFAQAMSAVVSQNYGAGKMYRARKFLLYAILSSLAVGVIMAYIAWFYGANLAAIFSNDHNVCVAAGEFLRGYAIDTIITSFMFCLLGYMNGCGKTTFVMLQGTLAAFCIRIPVAYAMSKVVPTSVFLISLATPCSSVCQTVAFLIFFTYLTKKEKRKNALGA